MTSTAPDRPVTAEEPDNVLVRIDELLIGRPLSAPLYSQHGTLLLAEGKVITSEFKRLLLQRGEGSVRMRPDDACRLRLNVNVDQLTAPIFDGETASKLDQIIETGLLSIQNLGPAAKERLVFHGRKAYSPENDEALTARHKATSNSMASMMREALYGRLVSAQNVSQLASQYLSDLFADSDHLLSTALSFSREASLAEHSLKMSTLGLALGVELGLNEENCMRICIAGMVHDWGMGAVKGNLQHEARQLTESEMYEVRKHPIFAAEMLEKISGLPSIVPLVAYQIHERMNGQGYPRGRTGDRIHYFARILAVADVYSALTSTRPHRPALMPYAAMECVVKLANRKELDSDVVRALLKTLTLFPIGSFVVLSNHSVARVIRRSGNDYSRPIVQVIQDEAGDAVPAHQEDAVIDLTKSSLSIVQALPTPGSEEISLTNEILTVRRPRS